MHVSDFFELDSETKHEMIDIMQTAKEMLFSSLNPDGWNIRINIGAAAGQTVGHTHIHIVPRYAGAPHVRVEEL